MAEGTGRIVFRGDSTKSWAMEIHELADIEVQLGEWMAASIPRKSETHPAAPTEIGRRLFALLCKAFVGGDRLATLSQLFVLSGREWPDATPEAWRNNMVLFMLKVGTLHELVQTLEEICATKLTISPAIKASWAPLNAFRKAWWKNKLGPKFRDQVGHHLGELEIYEKGLAHHAAQGGLIRFFEASGDRYVHGRATGAWNALLTGLEVQNGPFREFMGTVLRDRPELQDSLVSFIRNIFEVSGIPVEDAELNSPYGR